MDFLELSQKRYSVRKFSDKAVETEKLKKILEAGRLAPTAKNSQSHKIFVLQSEESLNRVRNVTKMTYNAPVVLMVCYDKTLSYKNAGDTRIPNYDGGEVDASIVTTQMMLEATELNLGTLWARGFDSQDIYNAFPEIASYELVCLLAIGYEAADSTPSPRHADRKPLSETVSYL